MKKQIRLLCASILAAPLMALPYWSPSLDLLTPQGGTGEANFHNENSIITADISLESPNWKGTARKRSEIVWTGGFRTVEQESIFHADSVLVMMCVTNSVAQEFIIDCELLDGLGYVSAVKG